MSRTSWLSQTRLNAIDHKLFEYRHVNHRIAIRKIELDEHKRHDNIGGSRGNKKSSPTEDLVIKWDEDITLKNLYLFRDTVDETFNQLSEELKAIFVMRWIEQSNTWEEIACMKNYGKTTIYRKRQKILETFAELSGEKRI